MKGVERWLISRAFFMHAEDGFVIWKSNIP